MPKLIGEYFEVKIGDSDTFQIPKVTFHKEEMMPDHGICEILASKFDSSQKEITFSLDDIPNVKLFEILLEFAFTKSSNITISRSECQELDQICNFFKLNKFIDFMKRVLQRDIYKDKISILKEEFVNNIASLTNENSTVSTFSSIRESTRYEESLISNKNSKLTWSQSTIDKLKLCSLGETSSETISTLTTSESSSDKISTLNSGESIDPENIQFQIEKKPSYDDLPNSWKAISEYEDFWKAWENGHDIDKIDISISKIQNVFENVHLPEPPLPTKQTKIEDVFTVKDAKSRLQEHTPVLQFFDAEVPPNCTSHEIDEYSAQDYFSSDIEDVADTEEFDDFDYDTNDEPFDESYDEPFDEY